MPKEYAVVVDGALKGVVYRKTQGWRWRRSSGGVDTYPRSVDLDEVKARILRVCRGEAVTLVETGGAGTGWSPLTER